jgi:hypothetical protein
MPRLSDLLNFGDPAIQGICYCKSTHNHIWFPTKGKKKIICFFLDLWLSPPAPSAEQWAPAYYGGSASSDNSEFGFIN